MVIRIVRRNYTDKRVRRSLSKILRSSVLCSMATVQSNGRAYINTAYFAYSQRSELFFVSYPDSKHCLNLQGNTSMAVAVFKSDQRWGKPDTGVQFFGQCHQPSRDQLRKAESVYSQRFPGFARWKRQLEKQEGQFPLRLYRFTPTAAKILDEKEFGGGTFVTIKLATKID